MHAGAIRAVVLLGIVAILGPAWRGATCAQTVTYYETGEEFAGPFPSWKNVKTDYGAKGDGVANDTAAIQRALDDMKTVMKNGWCVLYFPAGTYRIDRTLSTLRKEHNDYLGANLIGEDPTTTVLLWDGPADRPILRYDAWYCKVSRLRFDGRKKANGGLVRAGGFSTYCELSDLVFQDIKGIAVNLGNAEAYGAAEHAILRCKFLRCGEGISTINWNTLDINAGGAGGADGLLVDDADQAGGRVYGDQLNTSGAGGNHRCAAAIHVDGLQRADVTITSGGFGSCLSGIKVRGGAGRDARKASNQVAFLTGGTSDGCRLLDVVEGGSVVGEAFWYEGDWDYAAALLDLPEGSSGSISLAAAWWHMDSPKRPLVSVHGFAGQCAIVGSALDDRNGAFLQLGGDGRNASVLLACSDCVSGGKPAKLQEAWSDKTSPAARAAMFASNGAIITNKVADAMPHAQFVLDSLAQLRSVRIEPPLDRPPGATDVKLYRVKITAGDGKDAIRIQARPDRSWNAAAEPPKPPPTYADVKYGPYARNLMDVWQAKSDRPTPVLVWIHAGGFLEGTKDFDALLLDECLKAGIHHPRFGKVLKDKMAALGIECQLKTGLQSGSEDWRELMMDFVKRHFALK